MRNQKAAGIAFRLICVLFSTVLAILTLLNGISLTAQGERIERLRAEQEQLLEEHERLRVKAACAVDLEELEDYALRVLGMQTCQSEQIHIIHSEG